VTPDVVVDIGNTRMKWGLCRGDRVTEVVRIPLDDVAVWTAELAKLPAPRSFARKWAVASVNPPALHRFVAWSYNHGGTAVFEDHTLLPIRVNVDQPERVGLDRLFGAVAAKAMTPVGTPAITVDVGTAVTVNLIDADGVFQGGAIFPGPRLMSLSLHEHTAKLPHVDPRELLNDARPGKNTEHAIRQGIEAALLGGVHSLICFFANEGRVPPWLFVTGGGHKLLLGAYRSDVYARLEVVPTLTLEGIRIAAEALP
jgi:type III pantothenate kinase